jgi:SagB-type dehydrogenase family enzyme
MSFRGGGVGWLAMDFGSGAGLAHRLTSYEPGRDWDAPVDHPLIRQDLEPNDPNILPPPVKSYPDGLPTLTLPRDLPSPEMAATDVLAGEQAQKLDLDAAQLGRILFLGAGVVRTAVHRIGKMMFRASGSAGGRFPLEVYASTRGVGGVPDGVHWYDPVEHALVQVGPAAGGEQTTLIVTGIPWRTGWRYSERGWRHLYWDGGTLISQLWAAGDAAGLAPQLRTLFPDAAVADLVGADGVHEYPLALLTLGAGAPTIESGGRATRGNLDEVELPLCTLAQQAGFRDQLGAPWPTGEAITDHLPSDPLDAVILRRGSQRLMDPTKTLPRGSLVWPLQIAMRGISVPHWIVVHGVDDTEPGVYKWPDLDSPIVAGDLREELLRICLDQNLGSDAAYVVIGAISPDQLDDRTYRDAQLAAGIAEGRLHLAAYALGAGASGMTFLDSEVPSLLKEPDDLVTLLFTCVGVPEYKSRPGGKPGAPVEVTSIHPRFKPE